MTKRFVYMFVVLIVIVAAMSVVETSRRQEEASAQQGGCRTFSETGKTVCGKFLTYWQAHGGLAQQGYPLSDEFREVSELDGKEYTVQYFERAVFELHPEKQPPYDVLLSQLGTFQFKRKFPNGEPGAKATPTPADAWAELGKRPIKLPTVAPGGACPATNGKTASPDFGIVLGDGPIYPGGFSDDGTYYYAGALQEGGWFLLKVLWIGSPDYRGAVLIRGKQIDGANELRFAEGATPAKELRLDADNTRSASGWKDWPTYTRLRAPGCYAYQVDGANFSKTIVFKALNALPPPPLREFQVSSFKL